MGFILFTVLISVIAEQAKSRCQNIDHGGWELVRWMPSGNTFHPATDNLFGSDVYGNSNDMSKPWSIRYETKSFDQFLFAFGDCDKWLIADAHVVLADNWDYAQRKIYKSSLHDYTYTAGWFKRAVAIEDPWISLYDHYAAKPNKDVLYGENSNVYKYGDEPYHNGASVYIRLVNWNLISYFERTDRDEDDCLNFQEIAFDTADTDKDGELTSSEYISGIGDGTLERTSAGKDWITNFKRIDRNKNGVLTYKEYAFDIADRDNDGMISMEEYFETR